jgi:hypothetical protein
VGTDAEEPGDRVGGPAEEVLELEDLEALGGGVEGPFLARELVEASGEDGSGPGEGGGLELGLPGLCEGGGEVALSMTPRWRRRTGGVARS